ncbi:hypothetical protein VOLCADRAFT_90299 [Volvox carteri f. nagariensis]|uniref:Uncharacterized protein n=1 Tax=Volvox carteri f. nagariensis TaxID=3068 RepID=D8TU04_VOLCA|nr:uncharacterized protein VOLCADRAFT_90299 [Volvox carteri f. nagariensis]EFJ49059.1 hypothetical protein VOLCADRAFT_90299 [Volvox carteri f. nagariensis]|eukprot:XP_002949956.1 hypothetical protein VOLCADRAFT_90299 [Volvox carteri f. nagariensis]
MGNGVLSKQHSLHGSQLESLPTPLQVPSDGNRGVSAALLREFEGYDAAAESISSSQRLTTTAREPAAPQPPSECIATANNNTNNNDNNNDNTSCDLFHAEHLRKGLRANPAGGLDLPPPPPQQQQQQQGVKEAKIVVGGGEAAPSAAHSDPRVTDPWVSDRMAAAATSASASHGPVPLDEEALRKHELLQLQEQQQQQKLRRLLGLNAQDDEGAAAAAGHLGGGASAGAAAEAAKPHAYASPSRTWEAGEEEVVAAPEEDELGQEAPSLEYFAILRSANRSGGCGGGGCSTALSSGPGGGGDGTTAWSVGESDLVRTLEEDDGGDCEGGGEEGAELEEAAEPPPPPPESVTATVTVTESGNPFNIPDQLRLAEEHYVRLQLARKAGGGGGSSSGGSIRNEAQTLLDPPTSELSDEQLAALRPAAAAYAAPPAAATVQLLAAPRGVSMGPASLPGMQEHASDDEVQQLVETLRTSRGAHLSNATAAAAAAGDEVLDRALKAARDDEQRFRHECTEAVAAAAAAAAATLPGMAELATEEERFDLVLIDNRDYGRPEEVVRQARKALEDDQRAYAAADVEGGRPTGQLASDEEPGGVAVANSIIATIRVDGSASAKLRTKLTVGGNACAAAAAAQQRLSYAGHAAAHALEAAALQVAGAAIDAACKVMGVGEGEPRSAGDGGDGGDGGEFMEDGGRVMPAEAEAVAEEPAGPHDEATAAAVAGGGVRAEQPPEAAAGSGSSKRGKGGSSDGGIRSVAADAKHLVHEALRILD